MVSAPAPETTPLSVKLPVPLSTIRFAPGSTETALASARPVVPAASVVGVPVLQTNSVPVPSAVLLPTVMRPLRSEVNPL